MHREITIPELTEVVARLTALLGPREGGVAQIEGGITNRNYRVTFGGRRYVVRLPGKRTDLLGIDLGAECEANKAAAALGIAPDVAARLEDPACLVTSFVDGRDMAAEELRESANIATVARALRAFHDSGTELDVSFNSFRLVDDYAALGKNHGAELPESYSSARAHAKRIEKAIRGGAEHTPVPCHNDLLSGNFLFDGERIQVIDWEYAGMGDRYFDLGNFAVNNELSTEHEEQLLDVYFGEPPDARRRACLKLFRFMSDFREAMWGAVQTGLSELDFDFAGYTQKHVDRLASAGADPRFRTWIREARG